MWPNGNFQCLGFMCHKFWKEVPIINNLHSIGIIFFTKGSLCYCTNSLLMKHVDALKSNNASVFIFVDLLHLITIGNKKWGVGFENKLGPFWLHDALQSNHNLIGNQIILCQNIEVNLHATLKDINIIVHVRPCVWKKTTKDLSWNKFVVGKIKL